MFDFCGGFGADRRFPQGVGNRFFGPSPEKRFPTPPLALKLLLAAVANDPDRLARFSREAHVLASLNHPHIAQIYRVEDVGGIRGLVMEFVDAPTLAESIASGPG